MVSDLQSSQSGLYSNHMTKALTHLLGLSCTVRLDSFDEFNSWTWFNWRNTSTILNQTWTMQYAKQVFLWSGNHHQRMYSIHSRMYTAKTIYASLLIILVQSTSVVQPYKPNKHRPLRLPVSGGEPRPPRDAKVNFTWAGNFFLMPCSRFRKYVWCVKSTEKSPRDLQEATGNVSKKKLPVRFGRTGLI